MLDKTFRPDEVEPRLYDAWERSGAFKAGRRPSAKPFAIVIPPPNITGSLHLGHALNNTLQDILARFERMRGRDVLWQPGTDHAGIATQMVVERDLALEQSSREKIGREAFVKRVWEWKKKSGGTIIRQLKRLGCSCDWSRERFTMDEGLSKAVTRVFVQLYRDGLIYKDKRLVNWDPKLQTAISDLEVVSREVKGQLWHINYPLADDPARSITVATTRPETMLGDTAVAVHPEDERYKALVGRDVVLPLVGRRIPIIADEYADPEQGSGAVKITPAHDFNDFEVGRRHHLQRINIFDERARLNDAVPAQYRGLDRFEARKRVVADLEALGLVEKIEPYAHLVPHGDRSDEVVEPWLTDQWYVDAKTLAKPAIEAVERGRTVFVPRSWEKTYFEWLKNIEPWCISRQLWWGHRIPAWYGPTIDSAGYEIPGPYKVFVTETEDDALKKAKEYYGPKIGVETLSDDLRDVVAGPGVFWKSDDLRLPKITRVQLFRDPDVLDTWFSSQLWPFSTLGWPEETPALKRYYPTDVLVTGFDIIFFWVARMMMAGLHFMEEVPFKTVYIHALVRDETGAKMSKSKGNVMDPLDLIDDYGADALRFSLAAMAAQGRDIKLSRARIEGYRNFATKLWNAARFCQMNECKSVETFVPSTLRETVNRWIVGELVQTERRVTEALEAFKFNEAAGALYQFVWHVFCDWYIEFIKPLFADEKTRAETQATAAFVFDHILLLLHPFMPFVTEDLWARMVEGGVARRSLLAISNWPRLSTLAVDKGAMSEMDWVVRFISTVRSVRAEMNVPAGAEVPLAIVGAHAETRTRVERHRALAMRLARLSALDIADVVEKGTVEILLDEATLALSLAGVVDLAKEQERLKRELEKVMGEIGKLEKRLEDATFVSRAPEEVVEENRERLADFTTARRKLSEALARLSGTA